MQARATALPVAGLPALLLQRAAQCLGADSVALACAPLVVAERAGHLGVAEGELSLGRKPWQNLRTMAEMSQPNFPAAGWRHAARCAMAMGCLLRIEDQRANERSYLAGVARAVDHAAHCYRSARPGSAARPLPLGLLAARSLQRAAAAVVDGQGHA